MFPNGCFFYLECLEDGPAVGGQLGVGRLAEELGEGGDGVQFVCRNLERESCHQTQRKLCTSSPSIPPALISAHLRELAVSEPLQPPHAVASLPLAGGAPRHHDAGPPGEALDLPPDQLANAEPFVVLRGGEGGGEHR